MWTTELTIMIASFALACVAGPFIIPLMRKLKMGNTEREDGVETHLLKNGTPSMGGWIFILPAVLTMGVLSIIRRDASYTVLPAVLLLFGAVGFADDFLKARKKSKDGLLWWQKMAALFAVSLLFSLYAVLFTEGGSYINFLVLGENHSVSLGIFYCPFVIFLMLAESNATNLTDGLDGLLGGSAALVYMFFAVTCVCLTENAPVAVFSAGMAGALAGFLVFNYHPAKIFMGDTGSLAIGGSLGAAAVLTGHPFLIFFSGLLFVIEALSVILQVGFFKLTKGKRLFKMAPIHHHFEKCGWRELKVTYVFWGFVAVCCLVTYIIMRGFGA